MPQSITMNDAAMVELVVTNVIYRLKNNKWLPGADPGCKLGGAF